ncbi:MAG TPA: hypothetical protein GX699_07770, partial [Firmicutes bacterium]|nr:hypothetical protein [Bacillota bacterium]
VMLEKLAQEVDAVRELLAARDAESLLSYFTAAGDFRRKVPVGGKGMGERRRAAGVLAAANYRVELQEG